jgi:O-antigen/teichoic acid export membrane protein
MNVRHLENCASQASRITLGDSQVVSDTTKDAVIRRRVLLNTLSNYVGQVFTLGIWFFLTPFLLRQLGASAYGLWVLVGSVTAYGSLLDFGIASAVTKYVAEHRARGQIEQAQSLIATALWLYIGLGLIAIALSALLAPAFPTLFNVPPDQRTTAIKLVLLSGLGVSVALPCAITFAVLRGLQRFDLLNLITLIGMSLFTTTTVGALLLGWGVLGMVVVNIATSLLTQIPTLWLIHRIVPELRLGWRGANPRLIKTVASFSSALFVINIASQIKMKTDEVVIGASLPIASVTPYAIARRLSELPLILTNQFMRVLMPLAAQLHAEDDRARLRALNLTSTRLTLAIFVPLGCGLVILARPFLTVWVGPTYADSAYLVLILTAASLMDILQWPAGSILQGMARHRRLALIAICSALANLGLSIVLVRLFGVTGVALGSLMPTTVECLCFVLPYAMRVNNISARTLLTEALFPTLIPALPMALVLYGLRQILQPASLISIASVGGFGLLVYAAIYLGVGASEIERQTIRSIVRQGLQFARVYLVRAGCIRGAE